MESDPLTDLSILYEDNHVLVVNKPAGLLSQGDLSGDLDVLTVAKQMIKLRDKKPGNVYLGLVHRLDRPVGGVMVLAKTSKAAARLSKQFRERTTKKIYWAVVQGAPKKNSDTLVHSLLKDKSTRVTKVVPENLGGKVAKLSYRMLEKKPDRSLLEVTLITGLSHQIRAQLSAIGHPIFGDKKYGANNPFRPGRVALHSHAITFLHPTKKQPVTVSTTPGDEWPF